MLCTRSTYAATFSLSAFMRRAQASKVKVTPFNSKFGFNILVMNIFVDRFISVCRVLRSNYWATLSLSAFRRRAQAFEVKVASFFENLYSICE